MIKMEKQWNFLCLLKAQNRKLTVSLTQKEKQRWLPFNSKSLMKWEIVESNGVKQTQFVCLLICRRSRSKFTWIVSFYIQQFLYINKYKIHFVSVCLLKKEISKSLTIIFLVFCFLTWYQIYQDKHHPWLIYL